MGYADHIQKKRKENGLPDDLQSGIENLSGHKMDDVTVHRNSSEPAKMGAHAYAQGTDIFLGAGQEKHLAHEAWHVVQQKQGRVQATAQMKGDIIINDEEGLEHEADVMGAKALETKVIQSEPTSKSSTGNAQTAQLQPVIQRHPVHWDPDYDQDVKTFLELPSGRSLFKTTFTKAKDLIKEYSVLDPANLQERGRKIQEIKEKLEQWIAKHTKGKMSKREVTVASAAEFILEKALYEISDVDLSEQRADGAIDTDKPSSWAQTASFPTNAGYEITFRGLTKLKLGADGVDPARLGQMDATDQQAFERAGPAAILHFADTGPNISLSRSFSFANGLVDKVGAGHKSNSNMIVVTVVRPDYGIDVEANAERDIAANEPGITEVDIANARLAREVAIIGSPQEFILGWVRIPCKDVNREEGASALGRAGVINFEANPGFDIPGVALEEMENYAELQALWDIYGR